jgi:hypothetical protein
MEEHSEEEYPADFSGPTAPALFFVGEEDAENYPRKSGILKTLNAQPLNNVVKKLPKRVSIIPLFLISSQFD